MESDFNLLNGPNNISIENLAYIVLDYSGLAFEVIYTLGFNIGG